MHGIGHTWTGSCREQVLSFIVCLIGFLFPCSLEAINRDRKLILVSLYFLIWGEAANVRFLPECICYIFHHVSIWLCSSNFGLSLPLLASLPQIIDFSFYYLIFHSTCGTILPGFSTFFLLWFGGACLDHVTLLPEKLIIKILQGPFLLFSSQNWYFTSNLWRFHLYPLFWRVCKIALVISGRYLVTFVI